MKAVAFVLAFFAIVGLVVVVTCTILDSVGFEDVRTEVSDGCVVEIHSDVWGSTQRVERVCP